MEGPNMNAEPRNEREASQVFGGGSTDIELSKAFQLSSEQVGDALTGGHKEHMQMAGGTVEGIMPAVDQYLNSSVVIPEKYIPDTTSEPVPQIELMHFDFGTSSPAKEPSRDEAANEDDVRKAA